MSYEKNIIRYHTRNAIIGIILFIILLIIEWIFK